MAASRLDDRSYRILCFVAILHSVLLTATFFLWVRATDGGWAYRVWIGAATIWFFWPLVLSLHPRRSILRVAGTLALAAPLWILAYVSPCIYGSAYVLGWFQAERDLKAGTLAIEGYGFWGPSPETYALLRDRYHVEIRHTSGGCVVNDYIMGHAKGYNHVSIPAIESRWGKDFLDSFQAVPLSEVEPPLAPRF